MPTKREFHLSQSDPRKAPRMAPAIRAVRALLADGKSHPYASVVATALRASDLLPGSVKVWLSGATKSGLIKRTGAYSCAYFGGLRKVTDTRTLSIGDWPQPR